MKNLYLALQEEGLPVVSCFWCSPIFPPSPRGSGLLLCWLNNFLASFSLCTGSPFQVGMSAWETCGNYTTDLLQPSADAGMPANAQGEFTWVQVQQYSEMCLVLQKALLLSQNWEFSFRKIRGGGLCA